MGCNERRREKEREGERRREKGRERVREKQNIIKLRDKSLDPESYYKHYIIDSLNSTLLNGRVDVHQQQ